MLRTVQKSQILSQYYNVYKNRTDDKHNNNNTTYYF